jgi:transcriptional regulator with XRE-family HTH domain
LATTDREPTATAAEDPRRLLGGFIRTQRKMANLSLRQLSALTAVSNPYLSQVERGLHEPSVRVLRSIADALNVSAETLFEQAGLVTAAGSRTGRATPSWPSVRTAGSRSRSGAPCSRSTAAMSTSTRTSTEPAPPSQTPE